ncbi:DUF58 domain-containing protein [Verminephrobacter eiseniae]|uniref:DUF58 domain-containing protein n=1 Tax=Verminephrobacter eiseniae TaxID=364317 RepID=UPI002242D956|nr:DUF58 domain-containing protein [Verminephrobacter eiseniae]MCW8179741.1 DUF58 domain-containing protein [Verminephrobacter eiseniae]
MTRAAEELAYRIRWRAADVHPGSHRSRVAGSGEEFRGVVPLAVGRDARRIDLRASVADPFGRPWVREFRQRSRIPVVLLADLSRSMRFTGSVERFELTARFARALARGAFRRGDPFGFIGCDGAVRRELLLPPTLSRHAGEHVARQLRDLAVQGAAREASAQGLVQATRWLPRQRSLVFVVSDLYFDMALFEKMLKQLAQHEVVVVLLADSLERAPPARWGLVRLADLENARERLVFLHPGLADRLAAAQQARHAGAAQMARRHGASLLVAQDGLNLAALARHFLARGGT